MAEHVRRQAATTIRRPASGVAIDPAKLRRQRERRAWSRAELAERVGNILTTGFSRDAIAKIENGARRPKARTLRALCEALGCTPDDLLADQNPSS